MATETKSDLSETKQAGQEERKPQEGAEGRVAGAGGGSGEQERRAAPRGRRGRRQPEVAAADPVEEIRGLILLDIAAAQGYRLAIDACSIREIAQQLEAFQGDHERHVQELSDALRSMGAEPPVGLDTRGLCIAGYTELTAMEDRSALVAMRGNEELTNEAYASALAADLPDELKRLVLANFQDEHRHIRWINEELRTRGWLMPEVPPELQAELPKAA